MYKKMSIAKKIRDNNYRYKYKILWYLYKHLALTYDDSDTISNDLYIYYI